LKPFVCKKCNTVPEGYDYALLSCKDIICFNCSIDVFNDGLACPVCKAEIDKNVNTYVKFGEKASSIRV
jgi:hypothetical protein